MVRRVDNYPENEKTKRREFTSLVTRMSSKSCVQAVLSKRGKMTNRALDETEVLPLNFRNRITFS
jgi:hypothetical protein